MIHLDYLEKNKVGLHHYKILVLRSLLKCFHMISKSATSVLWLTTASLWLIKAIGAKAGGKYNDIKVSGKAENRYQTANEEAKRCVWNIKVKR